MTKTRLIPEEELIYRLQCPLRADGANSGLESPVLHCAESTARWLIAEIGGGHQPTAGETRNFFDLEWQKTSYFQARHCIARKKYERRLNEGLRACKRLRDLIWSHEILQPVTRYELPVVDGLGITGEYCVLQSSRRKTHAFVPYLRYGGVKIRPLVPDIVSFARYIDLSNRLEAQNWRVKNIGVLHYWVTQSLAAEHKPNAAFARQTLLGAVGAISQPPYPRTGEHCLTCPSRNCTDAAIHLECAV